MRPRDPAPSDRTTVVVSAVLCFLAMVVVLFIDARTPYATIHWILYIVPLLLAYRTRRFGFVLLVLGGIVACDVAGAILTRGQQPPEDLASLDLLNRAEGLVAFVCFTAIIARLDRSRRLALELRGTSQTAQESVRQVLECSPDAITVTDLEGTILDCNQAALDMHGCLTREEFVGRPAMALIAEPDRATARANAAKTLETGRLRNIEYTMLRKDGAAFPAELSASRIDDPHGRAVALVAATKDITERRRAEDERLEREQQYRLVSELATDYIFRLAVAPNGTIGMEFVSDNFYSLTGRRQEDALTVESWSSFIHPEDIGKLISTLRDLIGTPRTAALECRSFVHGRQLRWIDVFARSEWDERAGRVTSIVGAVKDITQRKLAEDAVLAEKERLAVTLASIADAVVATDARARVTLMNRVAEELTGWPLSEASGRPLGEIFRAVDDQTREPVENPAERVLSSGETIDLVTHTCLVHRDGTERTIADSAAPIKGRDGTTLGVVLVFRDTTEERKVAEAMQRAARLDSLGVLAGGIAHDFNNLLTGVYGYVDLARSEAKGAEVREYLEETLSTVNRARALTMQLLTFAKGGAPVRRVVPLTPFLQDTVRFALSGSNVTCGFSLADGLWACDVDRNQVGQVIDNVVINAQQAMPNGGALEVAARNVVVRPGEVAGLAPGNYVRLSFEDTGIGIPKDVLPRIFDPFYTTKTKGHGLGLATCHSIVTRHGGCIEAESIPGHGSTFHVYLPAASETAAVQDPLPTRHHGQGVMVVVDDEEVVRTGVGKMLERMGYAVACRSDGREAVELIAAEAGAGRPIAGMICDLTIPGGMGGKETVAEVRKINHEIPVFVMSGYADDDVMKAPGEHGFTGSIAKPFTMSDLAEMLGRQGRV